MKPLYLLIILLFCLRLDAQTTNHCNFRATPEIQQPSCANTEDGVIQINLDNPLGLLLTFKWTKLLGIVPIPLPTLLSNVARGLSAGDYQVIISNGLCSDTVNVNLPGPAPLQILDTAICGIGGVINLKDRINGGNGNYRINANTLLGNSYNCNNCSDAIFNVTKTSILDVRVLDQKGCETTKNLTVEVFDSLKANLLVLDETCTENGAITVQAVGGSGSYQYALDNPENPQLQPSFRGLSGNRTYAVYVRDNKFCRTQKQVFVRKNPTNTPVTLKTQDATCYGSRDGAIQVEPNTTSNSITGYSLNSLNATPQPQPEFRNLRPDSYTIYVLEGPDCYVPYKTTINEPDSMTISANTSDANCPGSGDGEVELLANGGNSGYEYSIDGVRYQSSNRFENLDAATYPAFARDQKGCTATSAFKVNEPETPAVNTGVTASCPEENTGSIVIIDVGGFLDGEYRFSLDSIYWQSDNIFDELAPGTYTIFVQDPNGCIYTVTAVVPEITAPGVFFRTQPASCPDSEDGSVTVEVTTNGETTDYFYSLDSIHFTQQNIFQNLSAGDYRLFMRDSFNCVFAYTFSIAQPNAPTITLQNKDASCFDGKDGKVTIQTQGGQAPFTYALNGIMFQASPVFTSLGASSYVAIVRDANGCLYAQEALVKQPSQIKADFTTVHETCGNSNGVLVCQPSGGFAPYRYRWDLGDTTAVLTNLQSGNYRVSISDANNCLIVEDEQINNLPGPIVVGDLTNVPCNGMPEGAIALSVFGGSQPFKYLWSNGQSAAKIYNLLAGNYTVTVTDNNQCASIKAFNLYEPAPIELQAETGYSNGLWFINLICEGGAPPYIYQWSTGETTEDVFNLKAAEYTVTVTDQQGCSQIKSVTVGTTATQEPSWASAVKIFPNPASDQIQIILETPDQSESTLLLLDVNGKIVVPAQKIIHNQLTLPVNHLPKGVYLLRLELAEGVLYRKVVLQ